MPPPVMDSDDRHTVTRLLQEGAGGQADSLARLLPLVYRELRALAASRLRGERPNHTLQPTALVHEAYMRLVDQQAPWQNRAHFFAVAAQAMRRVIIDYARTEQAAKRGGRKARVTLDDAMSMTDGPQVDVLALDQALERLAALDPRAAQIVELRFFAGLDVDETSEALGLSPATIKREWATAKAWLKRALATAPAEP
jgi:RNA polymerase sigma factor (TIGR02999 family)